MRRRDERERERALSQIIASERASAAKLLSREMRKSNQAAAAAALRELG
jgi:hypothetical protein